MQTCMINHITLVISSLFLHTDSLFLGSHRSVLHCLHLVFNKKCYAAIRFPITDISAMFLDEFCMCIAGSLRCISHLTMSHTACFLSHCALVITSTLKILQNFCALFPCHQSRFITFIFDLYNKIDVSVVFNKVSLQQTVIAPLFYNCKLLYRGI